MLTASQQRSSIHVAIIANLLILLCFRMDSNDDPSTPKTTRYGPFYINSAITNLRKTALAFHL